MSLKCCQLRQTTTEPYFKLKSYGDSGIMSIHIRLYARGWDWLLLFADTSILLHQKRAILRFVSLSTRSKSSPKVPAQRSTSSRWTESPRLIDLHLETSKAS